MKMDNRKSSQPAQDDYDDEEQLEGENNPPVNEPALEEAEAITPEEVQNLQADLEKAREDAAANFEGWQRERADFMNYKRRVERDLSQSSQNITGNIIKRYLPIVDDLERALKNRPETAAPWVEGIDLIYRKLQGILESEGVQRIQAEGEQFDPNAMEAISHEDSPDHESGQVIEVVQQGYKLGDRVLRPALVRVAR